MATDAIKPTFVIACVRNDLVLGAPAVPNGQAQQQNFHPGDVKQQWLVKQSGDNTVKICSVDPATRQLQCLDVGSGDGKGHFQAHTPVMLADDDPTDPPTQLWWLIPSNITGNFQIVPIQASNLTMDVEGGQDNDGALIQLFPTPAGGPTTNQLWQLRLIDLTVETSILAHRSIMAHVV